jgi:hypothetical protein
MKGIVTELVGLIEGAKAVRADFVLHKRAAYDQM